MDEIKTFLCGHYHIILLVELLNIYIYFISLFSISSRWVGGGGRISRGGGLLTCPVHVLFHVPFAAELKKYWEGFQLRRRLQGQKGNNISSWSLCLSFCVKNPGMFLFFGKWQRRNVFCGDQKYAFG